jgi:hypothetical protein
VGVSLVVLGCVFRPTILGELFHTSQAFVVHFNIFFWAGFRRPDLLDENRFKMAKTPPKDFRLTSRQAQNGLFEIFIEKKRVTITFAFPRAFEIMFFKQTKLTISRL